MFNISSTAGFNEAGPIAGYFKSPARPLNSTKSGISKIDPKQLNKKSKLQKAALITISIVGMIGLATLLVGPTAIKNFAKTSLVIENPFKSLIPKKAYQPNFTIKADIINIGNATRSAYSIPTHPRVKDEKKDVGYTVRSQTSTKTLKEWRETFTDLQIAKGLIEMGQTPDISCADILGTCHLESKNIGHRKKFQTLSKLFHPQTTKLPNDIAEPAYRTLMDKVRGKVTLGTINCEWQKIDGEEDVTCDLDHEITVRKELIIPDAVYGLITNKGPECILYTNENSPIQEPLDSCDSLYSQFDSETFVKKDTVKTRLFRYDAVYTKYMKIASACFYTPDVGPHIKLPLNACPDADCTGKWSFECHDYNGYQSLMKELVMPHWLNAKLKNIGPECFISHYKENNRQPLPLAECSNLDLSDEFYFKYYQDPNGEKMRRELHTPSLLDKLMNVESECHLFPANAPSIKVSLDYCEGL